MTSGPSNEQSSQLGATGTIAAHEEAALSAEGTVCQFFEHLTAARVDAASNLLAADVCYINVSLPTIRGRERVRRTLRIAFRMPGAGFDVHVHAMSVAGDTVLTERTDVLSYGPVRIKFWVCGRFDVVNGEIVMWKDYFDWWNFVSATARGVLGALVPATWQTRSQDDTREAPRPTIRWRGMT